MGCCLSGGWAKGPMSPAVRAIADGLLDYSTGQVLNVDGGFSLRGL